MDLEVDRDDLHHVRVVDEPPVSLTDGSARLRVDSFALTSNTITYAAFGDLLRSWEFFPGVPSRGAGRPLGRYSTWSHGWLGFDEARGPAS